MRRGAILAALALAAAPNGVGAQDLPAAAAPAASLASFLEEARALLLDGRSLPPGALLTLRALPPEERMTAVVWLRRAGLVQGPALDLAPLLAPARP